MYILALYLYFDMESNNSKIFISRSYLDFYMKNIYIAINSFVKSYHIFLKSVYQTQGNAGETYYCKNSGDIYYCFVFVVSGKLS